ncbi:MAG: LysE family transporter, partial [Bacteroidales bacterium]|nr:LysE family transporter [Bacteroidales bacterium]
MIETIILGISSGLGLAFMLGPAFFSLLQTSINRGLRSAVQLAFGIFLSDVFLVTILLFFGAAIFFDKPMVKEIVGLVGGGILVGIGVHTFLNRGKGFDVEVEAEVEEAQIAKIKMPQQLPPSSIFFVKGFVLNLTNPGTWIFWLLYVSAIKSQYTD